MPIAFSAETGEGKREVWRTIKDGLLNRGYYDFVEEEDEDEDDDGEEGHEDNDDAINGDIDAYDDESEEDYQGRRSEDGIEKFF